MAIDWNFDAGVPTDDFFDAINLNDPAGIEEAVANFVGEMKYDRFRTWEAAIRQEQGLPCTTFLDDLADDLLNFGDQDDRVLYVEDIPRHSQPWYEILRKLAPRLLLEPFRTSDVHFASFTDGWPALVAAIENRARGLSLPEDARGPLDVLPTELRHKLWLQTCFDALSGLGQQDDLTLADEEQQDRIALFVDGLREHRDSVVFLELTLAGLLQRVVLPERDQPIFVRLMCEQLGLDGPESPLAVHLLDKPSPPSEPVERLSDDMVKQAILHPEPAVREMAVDYFANSYSTDPTIAPLAIQAFEQYGCNEAFPDNYFLGKLAHTEQTAAWMVRQLRETPDSDGVWDDPCDGLAFALLKVAPALLRPHWREIEETDRIYPEMHEMILDRADYQRLGPEQVWERFEEFVADPSGQYPGSLETEILHDFASPLGRDSRIVSWVLETLARRVDDPQYNVWLEGVAVQMAGELKLPAALPYLVPLLHEDEDLLSYDVVWSLAKIGTDEAITELARTYPTGYEGFRRRVAVVLENIHTERAAATLLDCLRNEADETVRQRILQALLSGFVPAAIEPAREQLIAAEYLTPKLKNLRIELVALSTLAVADFPELEAWKELARRDYGDDSWGADEESDWDEEDWGDDEDWYDALSAHSRLGDAESPGYWPDDDDYQEPTETIVNVQPKIGRNAPCPCGSGKKYKKCCGN